MNKILPILLALLGLIGVTSCGKSSKKPVHYTLAQISNPTDADSLMYYFGQIHAVKYYRDAASDSTMRTPEAKRDYMEGMRDAMKALERSDAYLLGLLSGANHAENISSYSRNYGRKFNADIMVKSMMAALTSDTLVDVTDIRREFYAIRNRMEADRDQREETMASEALKSTGKELGMEPISNDIWKKVLVQGAGQQVKRGDRIEIAMSLTTQDGHRIPIHLPNEVIVGTRMVSTVFVDAMRSMNHGESSQFATTGLALFGSHTGQMDVDPETVLLLTITIHGEREQSDPRVIDGGGVSNMSDGGKINGNEGI